MRLLSEDELERSSVVANRDMNRERALTGRDGYSGQLGFHPMEALREMAAATDRVRWLDLCCGSGRALIEAARIARDEGWDSKLEIVGVDLAGQFAHLSRDLPYLRLTSASAGAWRPDGAFDVISCVHGLHYVGDKLGLIVRIVSWLSRGGRFAANLDLNSLRFQDGRSASRPVARALRGGGVQVDRRRKRIACLGPRRLELPWRYVGADDRAGPNYTGQDAVDSFYLPSSRAIGAGEA